MTRTRTEAGKRCSVGLKVSEAVFAAIEAARGETPRALWLEGLIDAELARVAGLPRVAARLPQRRAPRPSAAGSAGTVTFQPPGEDPVVTAEVPPAPRRSAKAKGGCPHPKARIVKGLCGACGTNVGVKS